MLIWAFILHTAKHLLFFFWAKDSAVEKWTLFPSSLVMEFDHNLKLIFVKPLNLFFFIPIHVEERKKVSMYAEENPQKENFHELWDS